VPRVEEEEDLFSGNMSNASLAGSGAMLPSSPLATIRTLETNKFAAIETGEKFEVTKKKSGLQYSFSNLKGLLPTLSVWQAHLKHRLYELGKLNLSCNACFHSADARWVAQVLDWELANSSREATSFPISVRASGAEWTPSRPCQHSMEAAAASRSAQIGKQPSLKLVVLLLSCSCQSHELYSPLVVTTQ